MIHDRPPRAMLVFPATSYRPDAYVAAAETLGIELLMATDLVATARRFNRPAFEVDFDAPSELAGLPVVDGVVAVDERSALVAAAIADSGRSRRPYHTLEGVVAVRDKGVMRERLAAAGAPCPVVRARVARGDPVPEVPFPCVVKPPQLSGSQGVVRADDERSLHRAVWRARHILHRHPRALGAAESFFELLVEDYVDGMEVAVEGLMRGGELTPIAIFDKPDPLDGPFFEETLYVTPSGLSGAQQSKLHQVTEAAATALGLVDGPIHAELRLAAEGPQLIEIAARSIGGLCSRALVHVVGSLEAQLLSHAVGLPSPKRPPAGVASGVMMIPVPRSGVLRSVSGVEAARAMPGVDAVSIAISVGETVRAAPDGESYLGFIFAHGGRPELVAQSLRVAHSALRFDLLPLLATHP